MLRRVIPFAVVVSSTVLAAVARAACAQPYPNKAVRLVIPFGPGGTTDIFGRFISDRLGRELGQPVIIENRAGGGGTGGRVKALAVVADARVEALPDVPTFAEVGLQEANNMAWYGLLAPTGTPCDVIEKIRAAAMRTLADPDTRRRLVESGAIIDGGSSEAFAQKSAREQALRRDIVQKQKLTLD